MPSTSTPPFNNTTRCILIGRENFLRVLILHGTTPSAPVVQPWTAILTKSSFDFNVHFPKRRNTHHTSIIKLSIEPTPNYKTSKWTPAHFSTPTASNKYKLLLTAYCTMPEHASTSSSVFSVPSAHNKRQQHKTRWRQSTNYLTMWPLTHVMLSLSKQAT